MDGWMGDGKERRLRTYSGQEHRLKSQAARLPATSVSFSVDLFLMPLTFFNVCCPTVI